MRFVMVMVLAGLVALPLSASAQDTEEGTTSEPSLQEPAPPSEPAPKEPVRGVRRWHPEAFVDPSKPASEPALQLKLDAAGVEVTPKTAPRTAAEEEMLRKRRVRIGLGVFAGIVVGSVALGVGLWAKNFELDL